MPSVASKRRGKNVNRAAPSKPPKILAFDEKEISCIQLPTELIDRIIAIIINSSSRTFVAISAFSLASSNFREIAFRRFFKHIDVKSIYQLNGFRNLLSGAQLSGSAGTALVRYFGACLQLFQILTIPQVNLRAFPAHCVIRSPVDRNNIFSPTISHRRLHEGSGKSYCNRFRKRSLLVQLCPL